MGRAVRAKIAQAWIAQLGDDPEAISALSVARQRLPAARRLAGLERVRVLELRGGLPERRRLEGLLSESSQFFNPHKERCTLRTAVRDRPPVERGDVAVLVWERGDERRAAAERWLLHETGNVIEVIEGTVWVLSFERNGDPLEAAEDLAWLRERRHGLLCNPYAQGSAIERRTIPLPWLFAVAESRGSS